MPFSYLKQNKYSLQTNYKNAKKTLSKHNNQMISYRKPGPFRFRKKKRVSVFTSLQKGSLTLEAAAVIPLLLIALTGLLYFGEVYRIGTQVQMGLTETGKELARNAYVYEKADYVDNLNFPAVLGGFNQIYADGLLRKKLKEQKMDSKIKQLVLFPVSMDQAVIDLLISYEIPVPISLFPDTVSVVQRARIKKWTGYEAEKLEKKDQQEVKAYVCENASVYHTNPNCTHLYLSVRSVNRADLESMRNKGNGNYYPCERCRPSQELLVYITDYGTRYHNSRTCSGLKRTVYQILLSEAGGLSICKKCAGG